VKMRMTGLLDGKEKSDNDDTLSHFDIVHDCDRQVNGQTELQQHIPHTVTVSCSKNDE